MAPAPQRDSLPHRLGRYEVVGFLASGGMAEILLGRLVGPSGFERPVVIKRMHPHLARDARFADVLTDEARLVARIRHPNVIQVYELDRERDELFLAMEYLEGESLGGLMRRLWQSGRALPPALAAHVVAETASGLHAAHELKNPAGQLEGLVHRDVTPQNVFVSYDGGVKLLDFGIAKAVDRSTRTETGTLKGKYQYMSPEQCTGKPLDRRSDVFALGIVLYELTTGRRLFKRDSELLTFRAICHEQVPPPSTLVPRYPPALEAIVLRSLQRSSKTRYQDAQSMRRDLLSVVHELGEREPRERLAELMQELFFDRMTRKQDMLNRVRTGAEVGEVPAAEVDESVELPAATQAGTELSLSSNLTPRRRGALALPVIAVVVAVGAAGWWWVRARAQGEPVAAVASAAALSTHAPAAGSERASAEIELAVETDPEGAELSIDGNRRGRTPTRIKLPRRADPVSLTLELEGYASIERRITPDLDQRVVVSLEKKKPAAAPQKPRRGSKTPEDFTRFE